MKYMYNKFISSTFKWTLLLIIQGQITPKTWEVSKFPILQKLAIF